MMPAKRQLVAPLRRAFTRIRRVARRPSTYNLGAGLILLTALAPPVAGGVLLANWEVDQWVALVAGLWTAFWFLVLTLDLGARSQREARALANAAVRSTMGALAVAGSRSFAGADSQALRIPHDALAALQHYEAVEGGQQRVLLKAIQEASADLVFGTICRADALPRSTWERLSEGAKKLSEELTYLAGGEPDKDLRMELQKSLALSRLCFELGQDLRKKHWSLVRGQPLDLSGILRATDVGGAKQDQTAGTGHTLLVLETLYAKELAVVKDWEKLHGCLDPEHGGTSAVGVTVTLEDVRSAERWYTPWYVSREEENEAPTDLHAVNVNGKPLNEAAQGDRLPQDRVLPVWPTPLLHGEVPREMRRSSVDRARTLLQKQPQPITVCALLYQFAPAVAGEPIQRLVLDGNHRIAGALKLDCLQPQRGKSDGSGEHSSEDHCPVRVLAFTITENKPITAPASLNKKRQDETDHWDWEGFTPDVQNVRLREASQADKVRLRDRQKPRPPDAEATTGRDGRRPRRRVTARMRGRSHSPGGGGVQQSGTTGPGA